VGKDTTVPLIRQTIISEKRKFGDARQRQSAAGERAAAIIRMDMHDRVGDQQFLEHPRHEPEPAILDGQFVSFRERLPVWCLKMKAIASLIRKIRQADLKHAPLASKENCGSLHPKLILHTSMGQN
jgi:hypothetical protein